MNVCYKCSSGISLIPIETERLRHREIYLTGEISSNTALVFFQQVMTLLSEDDTIPIRVFICSNGGEINAGLQIINTIESSPVPIHTICLGKCFSIAAVILASGNQRFIMPDGEVMLHEPVAAGGSVVGNLSSINSISRTLSEKKNRIVSILVNHTGKTKKAIESAIGYDHYFTADESNAFGITDQTIYNLKEIYKTNLYFSSDP